MLSIPSLLWILACAGTVGSSDFEPEDTDLTGDSDNAESTDSDDGSAEDDDETGDSTDTEDTDDGPEEPAIDERPFAMLQRTRSLVDHPVWGTTAPSDTTALMLVKWTRDGEAVTWEETLCSLESTKVHGTTTSYPNAFIDAIPLRTRTATIEDFEEGAEFEAGPLYDVIGADLDNAEVDPLPANADDPAELDQDGDGKPGMTVHVANNLLGEGDVYVAQRSTTTLTGEVVDDGRIEGSLSWGQEQVTLGATKDWLLLDTNSRPDTNAMNNIFVLQEVDEGTTCDDVMANHERLFGY